MTKLLSEALRKVAELPPARQDDAAHVLLAMIDNDAKPYQLPDGDLQAIDAAMTDVDSGHFASDREIAALLERPWA